MRRHGHPPRSILLTADVSAAVAAAVAAYVIRFETGWIEVVGRTDVLPTHYLTALPAAVALIIASASLTGAYDAARIARSRPLELAIRSSALSALLLAALALAVRDVFQYSRLAVAFTAALFVPTFVIGRALGLRAFRALRGSGRLRSRAAVVGTGRVAHSLAEALDRAPWATTSVEAVLPLHGDRGGEAPWPTATELASLDELVDATESGAFDEVYIALDADAHHGTSVPDLLRRLDESTIDVRLVPDLGDARLLNADAQLLGGLPVVSVRERPVFGVRAAVKRVLDVALSLALLVAGTPLLIAIAIGVRVSTGASALYRQERMGMDGRPFSMLKFRTMRAGAEEESGPVWAVPGDPRVTRFGRILRRFSLDELPQLINVLRGEMSLVGPRPERRQFIATFRNRFSGYMLRHTTKAGMTGLAQVRGLRGDTSLEARLRTDLEYIERWSLLLDFEILGRTAVHVLIGKNAY